MTGVLTKEELTGRLLALVLAAVLAWYTVVAVPAYSQAGSRGARTPDDGAGDGEVRRGGRAREIENDDDAAAVNGYAAASPTDELDWPEYIGLD